MKRYCKTFTLRRIARIAMTFFAIEMSHFLTLYASFSFTQVNNKVKQSRNRPGVAQRVPGILGS